MTGEAERKRELKREREKKKKRHWTAIAQRQINNDFSTSDSSNRRLATETGHQFGRMTSASCSTAADTVWPRPPHHHHRLHHRLSTCRRGSYRLQRLRILLFHFYFNRRHTFRDRIAQALDGGNHFTDGIIIPTVMLLFNTLNLSVSQCFTKSAVVIWWWFNEVISGKITIFATHDSPKWKALRPAPGQKPNFHRHCLYIFSSAHTRALPTIWRLKL